MATMSFGLASQQRKSRGRRLSLSLSLSPPLTCMRMSISSVSVILFMSLIIMSQSDLLRSQMNCDLNIDSANKNRDSNNHDKFTSNQHNRNILNNGNRHKRAARAYSSKLLSSMKVVEQEARDSIQKQWVVREHERVENARDEQLANKQPVLGKNNRQVGATNWQGSFHQPRRGEHGNSKAMIQLITRPTSQLRQASDSILGAEESPAGSGSGGGRLTVAPPQQLDAKNNGNATGTRQKKREKLTASGAHDELNSNHLYFELAQTPRKVQAHLGETAHLLCRLREHHGSLSPSALIVSWIRNEHEILTSADFRQTSDERFKPSHMPGSPDWVLEIGNVNERDQGQYECQVNSEPRPAKLTIQLETLRSQLEITDSSGRGGGRADGDEQVFELPEYAKLQLTCRLEFQRTPLATSSDDNSMDLIDGDQEQQHEPVAEKLARATTTTKRPFQISGQDDDAHSFREAENSEDDSTSAVAKMQHFIYWYRDAVDLQFASHLRQGIKFEQRRFWSSQVKSIESHLTIPAANKADSGLYTCKVVPGLQGVSAAHKRVAIKQARHQFSSGLFGWSSSAASSLNVNLITLSTLILLASLKCLS